MTDYLAALDLSEPERERLRKLGLESTATLLAMIEAARPAFEVFFGTTRTAALAAQLADAVHGPRRR